MYKGCVRTYQESENDGSERKYKKKKNGICNNTGRGRKKKTKRWRVKR